MLQLHIKNFSLHTTVAMLQYYGTVFKITQCSYIARICEKIETFLELCWSFSEKSFLELQFLKDHGIFESFKIILIKISSYLCV